MNIFTQCRFVKETPKGHVENVAWAPSKFAIVGKVVKIKTDDGWSPGWTVANVWGSMLEEHLPDWYKGIRGHRKSTGDSLPKLK